MVADYQKLTAIYWYCAIIGTIIFILRTALPIYSGGGTGGDFSSLPDSDSSFSLFTLESISAFFMCGGWIGWFSFSQLGYDMKASMVLSVFGGVCGMAFFAWLISNFKKLEHLPSFDIKELENKRGRAYMNFSPKGASKIEIEFNYKISVIDAKNDTDQEIKAFEPIKVTRVENGEIYISKE